MKESIHENPTENTLISVQHLFKNYQKIQAVKDVSFELCKGEVVGFLGPNGAGKTTVMRMLAGSLQPSSGRIEIANQDSFEYDLEVKKKIGYLPEIPPLYLDLKVNEQLRFAASLQGLKGKKAEESISKSLERCQLEEQTSRMIGHLSKGFRQRVGLAQALIGDPEILILDEPTVGLDPKQIQLVRELLQNLAKEHTVLLSTHILQEVTKVCQRVIMLKRGEIVLDQSIESLKVDYPQKSVEEIFLMKVED